MDAMTLVQKFGKPHIYLTFACNPNWLEIKEKLQLNKEAQSIPDLLSSIFKAKLGELNY